MGNILTVVLAVEMLIFIIVYLIKMINVNAYLRIMTKRPLKNAKVKLINIFLSMPLFL
jgi:hypothetical protein